MDCDGGRECALYNPIKPKQKSVSKNGMTNAVKHCCICPYISGIAVPFSPNVMIMTKPVPLSSEHKQMSQYVNVHYKATETPGKKVTFVIHYKLSKMTTIPFDFSC
jgi:hypothetical protein